MTPAACRLPRLVWIAVCGSALLLAGCPQNARPPVKPPAARQPLSVLVVDDHDLGVAIAREWRGRTEEEVKVSDLSLAELTAAQRLAADAVIFPSGLVGQLAERGLILPLSSEALEDSDFNHRDIFAHLRLREMRWGNRAVAVPLGSPQLLLAYRKDIFEKLGLEPPVTWSEYQLAVERLADRAALVELAPPDDQRWRAAVEPLAEGWAGQLLLARAAAYALHRDQLSPLFKLDGCAPLIDQPPYVRALDELSAAAKAGGFEGERLAPAEALVELHSGRCAMALTWPAPALASAKEEASSRHPIGFALLPGGRQAYRFATKKWEERSVDEEPHVPLLAASGRMAAVLGSTADPQRAQGFVVWLAGREISAQVGPHSAATTLFRTSQLAAPARWTGPLAPDAARKYAAALEQTMALPRAFPGLRLPGRAAYLAALDKAVQQAVSGERPAAEALADAAKSWQEITRQLDTAKQQKANARSLGQADL